MKHVTILGLTGSSGTMITGPFDIFYYAGRMWNDILGIKMSPFFTVEIVNSASKPIPCEGGYTIHPHRDMHEINKTELILIPSLNEETMKYHEDAIPWLLKHYNRGTHIAAMCTGTFLLAGTGLLDHKTATTHWGYTDLFIEMFPNVNLKPERLITDEGDLYCCGASNACFDLSLYLVEKLVGREIALQTAKVFICDMNRINQSEWAIFRFQKRHKDDSIRNAQEFMEKNYAEIKSVDDLAGKVGMSRRAFERRFKAATGDTPLKYLQRIRVEAAKRMIETQKSSFDEITYQVGYDNSSYFRKIFTKLCNMTPKLYRLKWGSDFPTSYI